MIPFESTLQLNLPKFQDYVPGCWATAMAAVRLWLLSLVFVLQGISPGANTPPCVNCWCVTGAKKEAEPPGTAHDGKAARTWPAGCTHRMGFPHPVRENPH